MADDQVLGSGASTPVDFTAAADEIAGKKYQRVKVSVGDDGTAADCGPSNPMPVSGALTVAGTMPTSVAVGQEVDGHSATLGTTTDAAASTTGSVIAQLRRIANLLAGAGGSLNQNVVSTATITWGVSAAAGTAGSATVTLPVCDGTATKYDKPLVVMVRNMSTGAVTLDCRVQLNWNDGSSRFALLTSVAIPAGATASGDDGGTAFVIDKANLALGGRLQFVNVSAGPVGGLSITVQVWQ